VGNRTTAAFHEHPAEENSNTALFLAGNASSYITGIDILANVRTYGQVVSLL
jgi:hypothetical protein